MLGTKIGQRGKFVLIDQWESNWCLCVCVRNANNRLENKISKKMCVKEREGRQKQNDIIQTIDDDD